MRKWPVIVVIVGIIAVVGMVLVATNRAREDEWEGWDMDAADDGAGA